MGAWDLCWSYTKKESIWQCFKPKLKFDLDPSPVYPTRMDALSLEAGANMPYEAILA